MNDEGPTQSPTENEGPTQNPTENGGQRETSLKTKLKVNMNISQE